MIWITAIIRTDPAIYLHCLGCIAALRATRTRGYYFLRGFQKVEQGATESRRGNINLDDLDRTDVQLNSATTSAITREGR